MARPKVLKPYRVSYCFVNTADNGKVRLWSRIVRAYDALDAKTQVINIFKGAPGGLVIVKTYRFYRAFRPAKRSTYIKVPPVAGSITTSSGQELTYTSVKQFDGPIESRPQGKCKMHPDATLEADGRCPALDANYAAGHR
jgi:hypothetical protein